MFRWISRSAESTTYTQLNSIQDENNIIISLSFQQNGQKMLYRRYNNGKVILIIPNKLDFMLRCKNLRSQKYIVGHLLIRVDSQQWHNMFTLGQLKWSHQLQLILAYLYDGDIKLLNIKLLVPQDIIRDQKVSKSKKQEFFESIKEFKIYKLLKMIQNTMHRYSSQTLEYLNSFNSILMPIDI
ncbi:unnamed protein product [Paramecium octaurelia]|uniref:Uncharacterized protein n=1 Tax=Paramecium octaurelia TaxID=43137 RepID=A0A8S1VR63_PAROT|nr:unnamed protein product [Paramecium octaurelia]